MKSDQTEKKKYRDVDFPLVLSIHKNRTNFEHSNILVPWKINSCKKDHNELKNDEKSGEEKNVVAINDRSAPQHSDDKTFHRFYHVFEEGELEELILSLPNLQIEKSYYDQGNWCAIVTKSK